MKTLFSDLTGGQLGVKPTAIDDAQQAAPKQYSIWCQFDNDEPVLVVGGLQDKVTMQFTFLNPGKPGSDITFTDSKTGKVFKLFAK